MSTELFSLSSRWQGRERFVVLQAGFRDGGMLLATWAAWHADPRRCERLHLLVIDERLPARNTLRQVLAGSPWPALASQLIEAWPPLTSNLHRLAFHQGRLQVLLAPGALDGWLPELVLQVDAFDLGSHRLPPGDTRAPKAFARLAAPGATLTADSDEAALQHGLRTAGFELVPGPAGTRALYAPAFSPRRLSSRRSSPASPRRHALVLGAGLAGCATAWALSEQGWSSTVVDRQAAPARETSGNPGGLFHGIVNPQDGAHARFNRAAALEAKRAVDHALQDPTVAGNATGLLRLEKSLPDAVAMRRLLAKLNLPPEYVQALDTTEASALCGLPLSLPAWFYPGGGWVQPAGLARSYLRRAGAATRFQGDTVVRSIRHHDGRWQLLSSAGDLIDESDILVLANAGGASGLLPAPVWPQQSVRGQISSLRPASGRLILPRLPLAGTGYLLPEIGGQAVFGATAQAGDDDPAVRDTDHAHNLILLARLTGQEIEATPDVLTGRTGWRCVTDDRLPVIGAVPDAAVAARNGRVPDQARNIPRLPGLFVFTALGSRGITWSALGAQVLASCISGAPPPLEARLLDAVDPARFMARSARQPG